MTKRPSGTIVLLRTPKDRTPNHLVVTSMPVLQPDEGTEHAYSAGSRHETHYMPTSGWIRGMLLRWGEGPSTTDNTTT